MKKVYIYSRFERFWHWAQASLIIFLAMTGFEVHGSFTIFGFEKAVQYHRIASWMIIGLIAFAMFWHITTGEWKQYIPDLKNLRAQVNYYIFGIFKGEAHPVKKTRLSKLNPLQRIVYLSFKIVLVPLTIISGILYMYYKTFDVNDTIIVSNIPLGTIALWHTLGAFLLMSFLVVHVYMTTTGHTPTSNIRAMLTGYEDLEENEETDQKTK
jgi:thiosulfate reductase cytochrome b subunit